MKAFIKITVVIICFMFLGFHLSAQGCGSILYNKNDSHNDFSSNKNYDISKTSLTCDDEELKGSGFHFEANYSISALNIQSESIFEIQYNGEVLFEVKFYNQKIQVTRVVQWKPCISWSNGNCDNFAAPIFNTMTYDTWDDEFIESTSGWFSITLADNGLWMNISKSSSDDSGPYKSDFSYAGIHETGIETILINGTPAHFTYRLPRNVNSGVQLTNIKFSAGGIDYIEKVTVVAPNDVPQSSYPSQTSNPASARLDIVLPVSEKESQETFFKAFPNPVHDELTISLPKREGVSYLSLVNMQGLEVHGLDIEDEEQTEVTLGVSSYPEGLYLVKFKTFKEEYVQKILIQK